MKYKHLLNCDRVDNKVFELLKSLPQKIKVLYADVIFEDAYLEWLDYYLESMAEDGIIQIQTDFHTDYLWKAHLQNYLGLTYVNQIIYKQEWGGVSKRYFPRKHDVVLIYAMKKDWYFNPKDVRVRKVTAGTDLDKGDGTKIPCDVWDDLGNFHTMSKERIKDSSGKNIQWQKPEKLMERLILPFTKSGDLVFDPMMGTGTTGRIAFKNNRNFVGVEIDTGVFNLASESMKS